MLVSLQRRLGAYNRETWVATFVMSDPDADGAEIAASEKAVTDSMLGIGLARETLSIPIVWRLMPGHGKRRE